jgi:hypothetical protein
VNPYADIYGVFYVPQDNKKYCIFQIIINLICFHKSALYTHNKNIIFHLALVLLPLTETIEFIKTHDLYILNSIVSYILPTARMQHNMKPTTTTG